MPLCIISPSFNPTVGQHWRRDIEVTGRHLHEHYVIRPASGSATKLTITSQVFSPQAYQKIAQATIYFRFPLAELSREHGGLDRYSHTPEREIQTSAGLIANLEAVFRPGNPTEADIASLMQFLTESYPQYFHTCRWYFAYPQKEVHFRPPTSIPTYRMDRDVIWWTELVVSFIQASLTCPSPVQLRTFPQTIRGLRHFLPAALEGPSARMIHHREAGSPTRYSQSPRRRHPGSPGTGVDNSAATARGRRNVMT